MQKAWLKGLSLVLGSAIFASCAHESAPPGLTSNSNAMMLQVKVKQGDNLQNLGEQYDVPNSTLQRINRLDATAALKPGQVLYIPVSEKALKSPDLRGRGRLVTSSLPIPESEALDADDSAGEGERETLYTELRQLQWPTEGRVSSVYGPRSGRMHAGIDIMAPKGRKIRAAHGGVVEYAGWKHRYGWTVVVRQDKFKTLYAHCSKLLVKKNETVRGGQEIAQVGATGNAEGTHLHFEYQNLADKALDPLPHFVRQYAH